MPRRGRGNRQQQEPVPAREQVQRRPANPPTPPLPNPAQQNPLQEVLAELRQLARQQQSCLEETAALRQQNAALQSQVNALAANAAAAPAIEPIAAQAHAARTHSEPLGPGSHLASYLTGEIPVDLHVDDKVKNRVWGNEAIDMALMLNKDDPLFHDLRQHLTQQEEKGTLFHVRLSESRWTAAWNIFQSIYMKRHPTVASGLAIHFQQVQKLMAAKGDWRGYDIGVRRMIQQGLQQWGTPNPTLYAEARLRFLSAPQPKQAGKVGDQVPLSYCIDYHKRNACNKGKQCRYKHVCYICQAGVHRAAGCWGPKGSSAEQSFRSDNPQQNQKPRF